MPNPSAQAQQLILYRTEDGRPKMEVHPYEESVWLNKATIKHSLIVQLATVKDFFTVRYGGSP